MLKNVDVLLYDIQDVGARFYTYISTMGLCMEASAEEGIEFVVLDRPNPLGGLLTEGPVLPDSLRSFVGMFPIPVVYGLTCGELASLVNEQGWLAHKVKARLTVIPMVGWTRSMRWRDTGLTWLPPSPNIRTPEAALIYPGTCLLEATNISEGRGTDAPFRIIGAPFLRNDELGSTITECGIKGLTCRDTSFIPLSSKFEGQLCHGAVIRIVDADLFHPLTFGLTLLGVLHAHAPEYLTVNLRSLSRRLGDPGAYELIVNGTPASLVADRWREPLNRFRSVARGAWLYPEE
jgi:beta-N-acetylhexosaminidase